LKEIKEVYGRKQCAVLLVRYKSNIYYTFTGKHLCNLSALNHAAAIAALGGFGLAGNFL
jgi:hypothetical protein